MNLKKIQEKSRILLIIFMCLQPIFDIYYLYTDKIISIFKFSPSTIIRMIFLIYFIVTSYLILRKKIKFKYIVAFVIVYFLYTVFHIYNSLSFLDTIPNYQSFSLAKEVFYIIRMLCPLLLVLVSYEKKLEYKEIKKIILTVYLTFSIGIIVTNFLGISLTSYAEGNKIIKATFFDWFKPGIYDTIGYQYLASKGIFHMANQVSGVMTMMFPLLMYIVLKDEFKVSNIITLFLSMLAMLMLGTRIASLGMFAVLIASIILYYFFKIYKKEKIKFEKKVLFSLIFLGLSFSIYPYLPVANRTYADEMEAIVKARIKETKADIKLEEVKKDIKELEDEINEQNEKDIKIEVKNLKTNFIKDYYDIYGMDSLFVVNYYNYEMDPDFWFSMFDIEYKERADYRELKSLIMHRVAKLNDNPFDYVVGFSFTRARNAHIYMENDILVHMYTIGIIGIILLIMPYFGIAIYALYLMFKKKKYFNYLNMTYIFCICLVYLIGPLTGNIFDEWIVTLFLGILTGTLLANVKKS